MLRQRNTVFSFTLHPWTRNCPNAAIQIEFTPRRTAHFGSAGCRIDEKFKCLGGYSIPSPQLEEEAFYFLIRHGRMMLNTVDPGFSRKKVIKMIVPLGGVLPLSKATDRRPGNNFFNSTP